MRRNWADFRVKASSSRKSQDIFRLLYMPMSEVLVLNWGSLQAHLLSRAPVSSNSFSLLDLLLCFYWFLASCIPVDFIIFGGVARQNAVKLWTLDHACLARTRLGKSKLGYGSWPGRLYSVAREHTGKRIIRSCLPLLISNSSNVPGLL